jgi:hypothetical protein
LSELLAFAAFVALVAVAGIVVGMIVAGRIDRLMTTRPAAPPDPGPEQEEQP